MRIPLYFIYTLFILCSTLSCDGQLVPAPSEKNSPSEYLNSNPNSSNNRYIPTAALVITPPQSVEHRATGVLTKINLGVAVVQNGIGVVDVSNNAPAEGFPVGRSQVIWTAVDDTGRTATARQFVLVDASLACSTRHLFFNQRIWPIIKTACMECHTDNIVESPLNFVDEQTIDYLAVNYAEMKKSTFLNDVDGQSLFLSKTRNVNNSHVGGEILTAESAEFGLLTNMVDRFNMCTQVMAQPENIINVSPLQQLRKTTLALSSRLPSQFEVLQVSSAQSQLQLDLVMDNIVNGLFNEDAFYRRLKEIYNDILLTDAFALDGKALSLDLSSFGTKEYFGNLELMQQGYNGTDSTTIRDAANFGVSQSPLKLIEYVVRNNFPFTEVLLADYVLVNPYSATLFNASIPGNPFFNFVYGDNIAEHNKNTFLPVKIVDLSSRKIPNAGLLSTLPFLSRYPSTNTNVNRKRARIVFQLFLGLDVEGLSDRAGLNLDNVIGVKPTLQDPQCKVCHDILDPVAGLFKNWGNNGAFLGADQSWLHTRQPPEMLSPGFAGISIPQSESTTSIAWLAKQIAADERFYVSTVKLIYKGITGIDSEIDPFFLQQLKQEFVNNNFSIKALIKMIVKDDHFLAANAVRFVSSVSDEYGTAQLLTPEQLNRKLNAIFPDMQWRSPSKRNLLSPDSYRLLYGGIDSFRVNERTAEATSLIAGVQMRIASQLSCQLVPQDFSLPLSQRKLFPLVEIATVPGVATDAVLIKQNIQFLFEKILGQSYDINHEEIVRVFNLFVSVVNFLGVEGVVRECHGELTGTNPILVDSNKTVRAWSAVINFMLRDYAFLYE